MIDLPLDRVIFSSLNDTFLGDHLHIPRGHHFRDELSEVLDSIVIHLGDLSRDLLCPSSFLVFGHCFLSRDSFNPFPSLIVNDLLLDWHILNPASGGRYWRGWNNLYSCGPDDSPSRDS